MRVLITGGAGFIGGHLAESYCESGDEVVVFDNLVTGSPDNVPGGADLVVGDVTDLDALSLALHRAEVVIHLAAARSVLRSVEDPISTDRTNTLGTLNVLVAARDLKVRRVVLASSSSVYGGATDGPTKESAPLAPKSPYAVSKLAGEQYARVFSELYGISTVSLRYFNVFGPRQQPDSAYAAVIPLFLAALAASRAPVIFGDGQQARDFTYVGDIIRGTRLAAEASATGAYNLGRGEQHTVAEVANCLADILHTRVDPVFAPERAGDVRRSQADITAARSDLGYRPTVDLKSGLELTAEWYLAASVPPAD